MSPRKGWGGVLSFTLAGWFALIGISRAGEAKLASSDLATPNNGKAFVYRHEVVAEVPWSIHILQLQLHHPDYELHTTLGFTNAIGMTLLSEQLRGFPLDCGRPVGAVNGDFHRHDKTPYSGDPKGLQILRGELVSGPCEWSCFWLDEGGTPQMTNVLAAFHLTWPSGAITRFTLNEERRKNAAVLYTSACGSSTHTRNGREIILERYGTGPWLPLQPGQVYEAQVKAVHDGGNTPVTPDVMVLSLDPQMVSRVPAVRAGEVVRVSLQTIPDLKHAGTGIGGGPALLRDGRALKVESSLRHPRTAVGWNETHLFLVLVDGRQSRSAGMRLDELAQYLIRLGCQHALNLDGGGSATCWAYGQVVNNPSEGRERPTANGLVVVRKRSLTAAQVQP